jgi:hypothetical protein
VDVEGGISWIWIGTHAEYDEILSQRPRANPHSLG